MILYVVVVKLHMVYYPRPSHVVKCGYGLLKCIIAIACVRLFVCVLRKRIYAMKSFKALICVAWFSVCIVGLSLCVQYAFYFACCMLLCFLIL